MAEWLLVCLFSCYASLMAQLQFRKDELPSIQMGSLCKIAHIVYYCIAQVAYDVHLDLFATNTSNINIPLLPRLVTPTFADFGPLILLRFRFRPSDCFLVTPRSARTGSGEEPVFSLCVPRRSPFAAMLLSLRPSVQPRGARSMPGWCHRHRAAASRPSWVTCPHRPGLGEAASDDTQISKAGKMGACGPQPVTLAAGAPLVRCLQHAKIFRALFCGFVLYFDDDRASRAQRL